MRHVADEQDVASLGGEFITQPFGRILGLEPPDHLELRERRTRSQECLGGLARPQLAAVPNRGRHEPGLGRRFSE